MSSKDRTEADRWMISKQGTVGLWFIAIVLLPFELVVGFGELCRSAWDEIDRRKSPAGPVQPTDASPARESDHAGL